MQYSEGTIVTLMTASPIMSEYDPLNPIHKEYISDKGDDTQRNFRYQHAWGAILLIAGACGSKPYAHIWCEHHEDLLAERTDNKFEAFQIKTRQPELGFWHIIDEEIQKSFKRFVELHKKFSGASIQFSFVSNTKYFNCGDQVKEETLKKSPIKFLESIKAAEEPNQIKIPFKNIFNNLCIFCQCTDIELFDTLKVTHLVTGPPRDGFDTEISNNHLIHLQDCKLMPTASLNQIRDEIIHSIYDASSLKIDDPYRFLYNPYIDSQRISPIILSKRVTVDSVSERINNFKETPFRYQPHNLSLKIGPTIDDKFDILSKKFLAGYLNDQITTMKRRTISAESRLLELASIDPSGNDERLNQLESIVQAECDDASLEVQVLNGLDADRPYGQTMLHNVTCRLKNLVTQRPDTTFHQPFEVLMGIAGLLTENCSVWWSKKFNIKDSI